jgi:hypothetical protein
MREELKHDPELCKEFLQGLNAEDKGFCRVTTLVPSKIGGYVQVSYKGANKFATLQEVLLWAKGIYKGSDQCSHLCGEPLCLCIEHVIVEDVTANNRRKGCCIVFPCSHCDKWYLVCKHQPLCVTYVPGFKSWEAFLSYGKHP